jgi:signal transduction histidine kinase
VDAARCVAELAKDHPKEGRPKPESRHSIVHVTKVWLRVDLAVGILLSAFGVILVSGLVHNNAPQHASATAAAALVLLMTLPVVWRRQAPVAMGVVLAVGAVVNPLVIGRMVRCGPALPALLLVAYAMGWYPKGLSRLSSLLGLGFLILSATVQCCTDPNLQPAVIIAMGPMIVGFYGIGRLVRSRTQMAAELERRNEELRRQRSRRAELAVLADRARIAEGLDADLNGRIVEMALAAGGGRIALQADDSEGAARDAFTFIQAQGRETLTHMRRVVGTLLEADTPARAPQPSLSQLDGLLSGSRSSDVHLHVTGKPVVLPRGLELSAYRTLELLLAGYGDMPGEPIDISIDFTAEALSIRVGGPVPPAGEREAALVSARARVDLLQGSLSSGCPGNRWETDVTLPLQVGA